MLKSPNSAFRCDSVTLLFLRANHCRKNLTPIEGANSVMSRTRSAVPRAARRPVTLYLENIPINIIYRIRWTWGFVIMCQLTHGLGLLWCFCSSAHCFATGFLPTEPRGAAVASNLSISIPFMQSSMSGGIVADISWADKIGVWPKGLGCE